MKEGEIRKAQNQALEYCRKHASLKDHFTSFALGQEDRTPTSLNGMISAKSKNEKQSRVIATYTINYRSKKISVNIIQEDQTVLTEDLAVA